MQIKGQPVTRLPIRQPLIGLQQHHRPSMSAAVGLRHRAAFEWSRGVPHLPMLLADPVGITASTSTTQTKTCTFLLDGGCSISGLLIAYKM